jgi:hypothetical protein
MAISLSKDESMMVDVLRSARGSWGIACDAVSSHVARYLELTNTKPLSYERRRDIGKTLGTLRDYRVVILDNGHWNLSANWQKFVV